MSVRFVLTVALLAMFTTVPAMAQGFDPNQPNAVIVVRKAMIDGLAPKDAGKTKPAPPKDPSDLLPMLMAQAGATVAKAYLYYRIDKPSLQAMVVINAPKAKETIATPLLKPFLKDLGNGRYRPAMPTKNTINPFADYEVRVSDTQVMFGHPDLFKQFDPFKVRSAPVMKLHKQRFPEQQSLELTLQVPENMDAAKDLIEKEVTKAMTPDGGNDLGSSMFAKIFATLFSSVVDPFAKLEDLSLSHQINEKEDRMFSFHVRYRKGADGKEIFKQMQGDEADELSFDVGPMLKKELQNEVVKSKFSYKDRVLGIESMWPKASDKAMKRRFSRIMMRIAFSAPDPVPTEWKGAPVYDEDTNLLPYMSLEDAKKKLPQLILERTYPGSWGPASIQIDRIPMAFSSWPNYEILKVVDQNGKDMLTKPRKSFMSNGWTSSINARVNKTKERTPTKMTVRFDVQLPGGMDEFEFTKADLGKVKRGTFGACRLDLMDGNAVKVSMRGGSGSLRFFPMDKTGKVLKRVEVPRTEGFRIIPKGKGNYQGTVTALKVGMSAKPVKHSFTMDFDLAEVAKRKMPDKPTTDVPVRFDGDNSEEYRTLSAQEFKALKVTWNGKDALQINRATGKFRDTPQWLAWVWSSTGPMNFDGSSWSRKTSWEYKVRQAPKNAEMIMGACKIEIPQHVMTLKFKKEADGKEIVKKLPNGDEISLTFDRNRIVSEHRKDGKKVFISRLDGYFNQALDKDGKRLKSTSYGGVNDTMRFWGQPQTFVASVGVGKQERVIPFAIRVKKDLPAKTAKAYEDAHEAIMRTANTAIMVRELHIRRHFAEGYADDLAFLHFMNIKKTQPKLVIPPALAMSDPKGATRFGYQAKPFRGYSYTVATGTIDKAGKKTAYARAEKPTKFKWLKGEIESSPMTGRRYPAIILRPTNKNWPTLMIAETISCYYRFGPVSATHEPKSMYRSGWRGLSLHDFRELWPAYNE